MAKNLQTDDKHKISHITSLLDGIKSNQKAATTITIVHYYMLYLLCQCFQNRLQACSATGDTDAIDIGVTVAVEAAPTTAKGKFKFQ